MKKAVKIVEKYYDKNKTEIKSRIGFFKHLKEGKYLRYHHNGKILEEGNYTNGKRNGVFRTFFESGALKREASFTLGVLDGQSKTFFENGNLETDQQYEQGLPSLDYKAKEYYENGQLMSSQTKINRYESEVDYYDNAGNKINNSESVFSTYHHNGKLKSETHFQPNGITGHKLLTEGIKSGLHKSFYDDGSQNTTCAYSNNTLNGKFIKRFDNGKDEIVAEYDNGSVVSYKKYGKNKIELKTIEANKETKEVVEKAFFANGKLRSEEITTRDSTSIKKYYSNKKLKEETLIEKDNKSIKEFYKNGILKTTTITESGKGKYLEYDEIGQVTVESYLKNNAKDGIETTFEDTCKIKTTEYKNGLKDGTETKYYESGSILSKGSFLKGEQVGEFKHYYENGDVKLTSEFKDGIRDGCQVEFYPTGNLKSKGCYKKDMCEGLYESYYPNGEKKFFINYKDNLEHGLSEGWDKSGNMNYSQLWKHGKIDAKKSH